MPGTTRSELRGNVPLQAILVDVVGVRVRSVPTSPFVEASICSLIEVMSIGTRHACCPNVKYVRYAKEGDGSISSLLVLELV